MIFTKKHVAALLAAAAIVAAVIVFRSCAVRQNFSSAGFTVILDAGHGAYV